MKKIIKTFALLLGSGTCIANCPKAAQLKAPETKEPETVTFSETKTTPPLDALATFQDLDRLYFI